jgi:hypothetical protein
LFGGFEVGAEVVRTRVQDMNEVMAINTFSPQRAGSRQERTALFRAATNWGGVRG